MEKLRSTSPYLIVIFLLLSVSSTGNAQSGYDLIKEGDDYFERDQLDSARFLYDQAYQKDGSDIQLQAISGLIRISVAETAMAVADSLLHIGDRLMEEQGVDLEAICRYKSTKGEFYRKNSQFDQALALQQEVVRLSGSIEEKPLIHAYALYYTALTFERMTKYDSSLIYAERAHSIFQQHMDTTDLRFSTIYNGIGACYYRANRLEEARQFYLKSKAIAEKQLGPVSSNLAFCLSNLSSIARAEENYLQAIDYTEKALKIYRARKDEQGISSAYYSLGVYHYYLGDYGRTKDYMEACIAIREQLFAPDHFSLIGPYEVLGIALEEAGDYQKTLFYLEKVRTIILANYGTGSIVEGFNYENTAICYMQTGQLDSALHYIQLSNAILPRQLPENDYSLAVHYFSYANLLYQMNELEEASVKLLQSSRIMEAIGLDTSTEYAQNLALQALIQAEKKNWTLADRQMELALNAIRLPKQEDGPAFKMSPNALWVLNEYMDYQYRKYRSTKNEAALQLFEEYTDIYLDLSDKFRKQFIDPYTKSILIKDNAEVYERTIGIYHHLYRQTRKEDYLKAAYRFSEYGRACLLRDLQDEKVRSYAGLPDSLLEKEQRLKKRIAELNQQLLDESGSEKAGKALFQTKEALNRHIAEMEEAYPRYHDLKFNSSVPDLEAIQSQLKKGENLIEYMQDDTAYYGLVVNPQKTALIYLGNRERINRAITQWKESIVQLKEQPLQAASQLLFEQLWFPLASHLEGQRVTVIPVGPLFYLNFETLPDASSAGYLIESYNISYGLSFTVLFSEDNAKAQGPVMAVAPGFEEEIKRPYKDHLDSLEALDEEYLRTVRQPWSMKLVKNLEQRFVHQVFTGLKATEANIKANIHKGKVLYFGTHAIANSSDPLRSKLVLAKEVGEQKEDGYLHAYELYGLPLQAELAVLNACESGLGNLQKGEGMISLAYSIHYAGCPSTVMSLWKVDEKISTQITESFLDYLDKGLSKSEALRRSKLDYLTSSQAETRHPFYWGGMVLMGKDGQVDLEGKGWKWYWVLSGGFFVFLLGYGGFRYFKR